MSDEKIEVFAEAARAPFVAVGVPCEFHDSKKVEYWHDKSSVEITPEMVALAKKINPDRVLETLLILKKII